MRAGARMKGELKMKKWILADSEYRQEYQGIVQFEQSFSTAQIEQMIFQGEISPAYFSAEEPSSGGEFMLIGDELMKLDRQNLPGEIF